MAIRGGRGGGPGGGGRSHFSSSMSSGGRSHSSSSRSSSRSSHIGIGHRHYHGGGIHIGFFHGRPLTAGGALVFLGFFLLMITIMLGIGIGTTNNTMKIIKTDYNNYQSMIEMAMENDDYKRYATITGKYQSTNDKWYYVYELDYPNYDYETFAIYSKEEIDNYKVGQQIPIAVENIHIDIYTATIPFDYYGTDIKDDAEYISASKTRTILILIAVATGLGGVGLIVLGIKKSKNKKAESATENGAPAPAPKTHTNCKYCGCRVSVHENNCPKCGAQIYN